MKILCLLFLLCSCAVFKSKGPKDGKRVFSYQDVTGSYRMQREIKTIKNKIVARNQLMLASGNAKVVEKSVTVAEIGSIQDGKKRVMVVRPTASEFIVWLEGKRYQSRMKLVPEKKSIRVTLESPEKQWQGTSDILVPKGRFFCFYSQLAECLYHNRLLESAQEDRKQEYGFYIVWDNYPYLQEQLSGVGTNVFSAATVKFDGEIKKRFRYIIEVEGQVLLYHFSTSFALEKIAWISQGITMVPPGEEENDIDNQ